ncbi:MAG: hypothetical protein R8K54_06205 [Mariprofundaceae bacterium]
MSHAVQDMVTLSAELIFTGVQLCLHIVHALPHMAATWLGPGLSGERQA